ncbi:hypothetical protein BH09PSE5_BH09PSE5_16840 [soil metagenome]
MEKSSLIGQVRVQPVVRTAVPAVAALLRPAAPLSASGGFSRARFADRPPRDVFSDLLSANEYVAGERAATSTGWSFADNSAAIVESEAASLGDYEALLQSSKPDQDGEPGSYAASAPSATSFRQTTAVSQSAADYDRADPLSVDDTSIEHFSISHPRWGLLDVDSRRSGASWNVVVRCGDAGTRHLLKSREREFREILGRDFGIDLELDVQPVAQR